MMRWRQEWSDAFAFLPGSTMMRDEVIANIRNRMMNGFG
jgi:hypothetical protein